jgi:hypothetical protein
MWSPSWVRLNVLVDCIQISFPRHILLFSAYLSQVRTWISNVICCGLFIIFNELRWKVIFRFAANGGIVDHHSLLSCVKSSYRSVSWTGFEYCSFTTSAINDTEDIHPSGVLCITPDMCGNLCGVRTFVLFYFTYLRNHQWQHYIIFDCDCQFICQEYKKNEKQKIPQFWVYFR